MPKKNQKYKPKNKTTMKKEPVFPRYNVPIRRYSAGVYNPDGTPKGGQFGPKVETKAVFTRKSTGQYNAVWILTAVIFFAAFSVISAISLLRSNAAFEESEALRNEQTGLKLEISQLQKENKQTSDDLVWLTKAYIRDNELNTQLIENLQSKIILKR